jgi:hypothetical protein
MNSNLPRHVAGGTHGANENPYAHETARLFRQETAGLQL